METRMHSERGLLINGTRRRYGESRPARKSSGTLYELIVASLPNDARAPAEENFGPIVAITPPATDEEDYGHANGDVHGLAACASIRSATPFGGIKHSGVRREGAADSLDTKLGQVALP